MESKIVLYLLLNIEKNKLMILNKPYKERYEYLVKESSNIKYAFTLARQALYHYLLNCSEQHVLMSRFSPLGAFIPIIQANKKIIFYDVGEEFQILTDGIPIDSFDKNNTIFYYIHPFGMYISQDIHFIKDLKLNSFHVIDDRSLSLPISNYNEFADATLYSLYKSCGVPYGAYISTDKEFQVNRNCDEPSMKLLHEIMNCNQAFFGSKLQKHTPLPLFLLLNKILHNKIDFNRQVEKSWNRTDCILEENIIHHLNFEMISKRRIENASIYLENINSEYLFQLNNLSYINQSIIGFPIKTDEPERLYKYLKKHSIIPFSLRNGWWMDNNCMPTQYYYKHLLLPIHHYLSECDVIKVCKLLNRYKNKG